MYPSDFCSWDNRIPELKPSRRMPPAQQHVKFTSVMASQNSNPAIVVVTKAVRFFGCQPMSSLGSQGDRNRTCGLIDPNDALYQAELHPEKRPSIHHAMSVAMTTPLLCPFFVDSYRTEARSLPSHWLSFNQTIWPICGR